MNQDVILWIFGALIGAITVALGYLASRVNSVSSEQAKLAQHVAENYVRGHEVAEVKRAVEMLRQELTQAVGELRTDVAHQLGELTKILYQLIGQQGTK